MTMCECGCGVFFTKSCERQRFASEKCRKKVENQRRNGAPGSARREAMRARWRGEKVTIQVRKREAAAAEAEAAAKAKERADALAVRGQAHLCAACKFIVRRGSVNPCSHPGLWSERFAGKPAWMARTSGNCPLPRCAA